MAEKEKEQVKDSKDPKDSKDLKDPKQKPGEQKQEVSDLDVQLAKEFKEYSVAEFFKRNRQMLGYSGKVRSLTTIVHEYVTNSLDACEDAGILPDIKVQVDELENGHVKVLVEDNGTGVPRAKIGQALGKLLAGTKFHQRKQKRGQQGIGAAYATLFSQITTGKPTKVKSGTGNYKAYECEVSIDVKTNEPEITNVKEFSQNYRGLKVEAEFSEVTYNRSEYSVYEYLRRTALANPHAQVTLVEPSKEIIVFPRATKTIPARAENTLPHPLGVTTSDLMDMAAVTKARKLSSFLTSEFSRVSNDKVKELETLCKGVDFNRSPASLQWPEAERIANAVQQVKWIAPETSTIIAIGEEQLVKSLKNLLEPEHMKVVERKPKVFRGGIPFLVEAAVAFGGKTGTQLSGSALKEEKEEKKEKGEVPTGRRGELLRFANKVPLLFDAGSCAITEAVKTIDWSRYDLKDWESMPVTIFVNFVSVYVPYTGAGKLSISQEAEIVEEIRFALMEAARDVSIYLHSIQKMEDQERRRQLFFRYIGEVSEALHDITGKEKSVLMQRLKKIAEVRTALAEQADEEGDKELQTMEEEAGKEMEEEGR